MWARQIALVGLTLVLLGLSAHAKSPRIVGAVASVTTSSLDVMTKNEGTKSLRLDSGTLYSRWMTHKPFQGSRAADFTSLSVGRCVEVDLRSADTNQAKMVWVSTEPIGSIYDPCLSMRK